MDNEPYRDITHDEAEAMLAAEFTRLGHHCRRQFRLPDGRIADVFVITPAGQIEIVEVKTAYKASLVDEAIEKYARWCNSLWFAVPDLVMVDPGPSRVPFSQPQNRDIAGLLGVYRQGLAAIRLPKSRPLNEGRAFNLRCLAYSP